MLITSSPASALKSAPQRQKMHLCLNLGKQFRLLGVYQPEHDNYELVSLDVGDKSVTLLHSSINGQILGPAVIPTTEPDSGKGVSIQCIYTTLMPIYNFQL